MTGFGLLPALNASTRPPVRKRNSSSAIAERALLPVQTNSTANGVEGSNAVGAGVIRKAGCSTVPAPASSSALWSRSRW